MLVGDQTGVWTLTENFFKRRSFLFVALVLTASSAVAQATGDVSEIYSSLAFSGAGIVVLILALVIFRKFSKRRGSNLADDSGLNLMAMKQKNLLTPEEMKMVSQAIARRMAEKETQKRAQNSLTTSTLLYDPEVVRLQEEAMAKRQQDAQETAVKAGSDGLAERADADEVSEPETDVLSGGNDGMTEAEDVALPPEVQQLADAGILTEEEIENVRRRLRTRGQS